DGDGSLLMNLGSLATIGLLAPAHLVLIVMDNEEYATTGRQKTPTAHGADLDAAARAMGIAQTATARGEGELRRAIEHLNGPLVVIAKVAESAPVIMRLAGFAIAAVPPATARAAAARAVVDTVGVTLAGATQPAARIVQRVIEAEGGSGCTVLGTAIAASPGNAALANGTAAHAHDYDDMCFVSLAHPSAPLVAAGLAAAEIAGRPGAALLDAYVVGFEIEGRLGRTMNPRHYQRGWHCTATIGTLGAAAAAARLLGLDARQAAHALAIAASEASGLKENFGTMVKPLHAGLAARNGVLAAQL